jgi:hypothetical protein
MNCPTTQDFKSIVSALFTVTIMKIFVSATQVLPIVYQRATHLRPLSACASAPSSPRLGRGGPLLTSSATLKITNPNPSSGNSTPRNRSKSPAVERNSRCSFMFLLSYKINIKYTYKHFLKQNVRNKTYVKKQTNNKRHK